MLRLCESASEEFAVPMTIEALPKRVTGARDRTVQKTCLAEGECWFMVSGLVHGFTGSNAYEYWSLIQYLFTIKFSLMTTSVLDQIGLVNYFVCIMTNIENTSVKQSSSMMT